jgi:hypothetical protein
MAASPLESFKGKQNVLVLFAPTKTDAGYTTQQTELNRHAPELRHRDVVRVDVLIDNHAVVDGKPVSAMDALAYQNALGVDAGFMLALVGKDGMVKLKSTDVVPAPELLQMIDSMPADGMMRREGL